VGKVWFFSVFVLQKNQFFIKLEITSKGSKPVTFKIINLHLNDASQKGNIRFCPKKQNSIY